MDMCYLSSLKKPLDKDLFRVVFACLADFQMVQSENISTTDAPNFMTRTAKTLTYLKLI